MNILVVDDDRDIADIIGYSLRKEGHRPILAHSGQQALELAERSMPDLVVLDVMLPDLSGFDVCRRLRARGRVPVILLTARGEEADRVWGLDLGADDYVTKPFSHRELLARIRAVWRRAAAAETPDQGSVSSGDLRLDFDRHEVRVAGRLVDLTPREYEVLHCLALNTGRVVPHERLLAFVWGNQTLETDIDQLKVHVRHLREKLERSPSTPEYLLTVRGVGYKLADHHSDSLTQR
ncbi:MAG: response regulator transcription factor [Chloroflexi bacterium]|nr:response regulator transcription factor [Chloroflexota bacterium]MBV9601424.1 response regulator transcription factor [Chloroflexota bacterium]